MNIKDFATRWALHYVNPDFLKIPFNNESGGVYYYYPLKFLLDIPSKIEARLQNKNWVSYSVRMYMYYYDKEGNKKFLKIQKRTVEEDIVYFTFRDIIEGESKDIEISDEQSIFVFSKECGQNIYVQENFVGLGKIHLEILQLSMLNTVKKENINTNIEYNTIRHELNYLHVSIAPETYDIEVPAAEVIEKYNTKSYISDDWYAPGIKSSVTNPLPGKQIYSTYLPEYENNLGIELQMTVQEKPPIDIITDNRGQRLQFVEYLYEDANERTMGIDIPYGESGWIRTENISIKENGSFSPVTICNRKTTENYYYYKKHALSTPSYFINGIGAYLPNSVIYLKYSIQEGASVDQDMTRIGMGYGWYAPPNDGPGTKECPPGWSGPYVTIDWQNVTVTQTHSTYSRQGSSTIKTTDFNGITTTTETVETSLSKVKTTRTYEYHNLQNCWNWYIHVDYNVYQVAEVSLSKTETTEEETITPEYRPEKVSTSHNVIFSNIVRSFATAATQYLSSHPEELIVDGIKYDNIFSLPLDYSEFDYYGTPDLDIYYTFSSEREI